jgi:lipopolysaccharide transport system ATP-binding protein
MLETRQKIDRPVISASNLFKRYCRDLRRSLWYGLGDIAQEFFWRHKPDFSAELRQGEFWALKDISFELSPGESLAIIGANGAGKSTLLKVLYGLVKPDGGSVRIGGRVGALIELGTGFNPVLSGRENVYVNAAILGLPRKQVALLLDKIVDFAGLDGFMDTPVQYYSSGMRARLAYAVAAHLNPDLLLVDEVLAVGDYAYQRKCIGHMQKYLDAGGSLVFVSHNLFQIQTVCERGIVLERGRLTFSGTSVEALNYYLETQSREVQSSRTQPVVPDDNHPIVIEGITAEASNGDLIRANEDFRLVLKYRALERLDVIWGFSIWTGDQWVCVTGDFDMTPRTLSPGSGELRCLIPRNPLVAGSYWLKAAIVDPTSRRPLAMLGWKDSPQAFSVRSHPTELNNAFTIMNQLVTLDVKWE